MRIVRGLVLLFLMLGLISAKAEDSTAIRPSKPLRPSNQSFVLAVGATNAKCINRSGTCNYRIPVNRTCDDYGGYTGQLTVAPLRTELITCTFLKFPGWINEIHLNVELNKTGNRYDIYGIDVYGRIVYGLYRCPDSSVTYNYMVTCVPN